MQEGITRILTKWTWKDMRNCSQWWTKRTAVFLREPNYRIPFTTLISALIRKDFEDGKILVKEQLKGNTIALTTDIWTSRATQAFATTTAHFINKQWNLTTCVIETVHFLGYHTSILISQKLKEALSKFDVSTDQVSTVVHNEVTNAVLAGGFYIAYPYSM